VLLITYELAGTGRAPADHARLRRLIGASGPWAQLTEHAFVVQTDETAEQVRDALLAALEEGADRLFVGTLAGTAAWHNVICPSTWLKGHL
jgi:methionine synthase I (cobalamin-dependent)